jgi:hypothetical protein
LDFFAAMRDAAPEDEVAIWCSISAAWIAYHEKHLGDETLSDEDEKNLLGALLSISTGVCSAENASWAWLLLLTAQNLAERMEIARHLWQN